MNHTALPNGFSIWHVPSRSVPAVHLRFVVRAGWNLDRDRPGLSQLTALALAAEARPAGSLLPAARVRVAQSVTSFAFDLPRSDLDEAVDLLGAWVHQPHLDNPPLAPLRELVRARCDVVRSEPVMLAEAMAARELFGLQPLPTAADLARVAAADLKAYHKTAFVPANAGLVAVGDVTFDDVVQAARRAFGAWEGQPQQGEPPAPPAAVPYTRVFLSQRPGLAHTTLVMATPAPSASDPSWPQLWIARSMIASRLTPDSSCAPSGPADVLALEAGPSPTTFSACQRSADARVVDAAGLMLEAMSRLSSAPASAEELTSGRDWLQHSLANGLSSTASLADLFAGALGAAEAHDATARKLGQLRSTDAAQVRDAVRPMTKQGLVLLAVTSDGSMAERLARFGDVVVLDADDGLARKRQIPAAPVSQAAGR